MLTPLTTITTPTTRTALNAAKNDQLEITTSPEPSTINNESTKASTSTTSPTNTTNTITPETALADNEYFNQRYTEQLQEEHKLFPGYNVISNPPRSMDIVEKAPRIFQYELARFMSTCQISWGDLDLETAQRFLHTALNRPQNVHNVMMNWYSSLRTSLAGISRPHMTEQIWNLISMDRCSEQVWNFGLALGSHDNDTNGGAGAGAGDTGGDKTQQQQDTAPNLMNSSGKLTLTRALRYTAKLVLPESAEDVTSIQLNVPRIQASNRFFRKFGEERFLELQIAKHQSLEVIEENKPLILRPFLLMGRTYRFLFLKDTRVILFATDGPGLSTISLRDMINWHIPIKENWHLTTCKFASRMSLGYSNSMATVEFDPKNVRLVDDVFAEGLPKNDDTCMTDGCGIVSAAAMRKIMGSQQHDILPCAVQGRIGGAKGLWIVPPDLNMESGEWIEIRASQHKFKTGLPDAKKKTDPIHFTFDVVKNAFCIYPSHLNTQFIQCLSSGGVPTGLLVDLLREHIDTVVAIITDNRNIRLLRDWLVRSGGLQGLRRTMEENGPASWQRNKEYEAAAAAVDGDGVDDMDAHGGNKQEDGGSSGQQTTYSSTSRINGYSGFPSNLHESIVRLLDAGFDLTNTHLASKTTTVFKAMLQTLSSKYRVEVQQSCTLMCIPDPTGILKPNEVFLQLSNRKVDEKTGIHAGLITGDILVTRNPCGLKSDIQKVRAVDCSVLRVYSDVIVCPIQGNRSLASKLSGGDYDGDLIFCCWDRRLVEPFNPSPVPDTSKRISEVFETDARKVRDEIAFIQDHDEQMAKLQSLFLSVPVYDGTLGVYENWRTVVAELTSLDTPDAIYLAQMCALLVDAPKQGFKVKPWAKREDRIKYGVYPAPKWFADKLRKSRDPDEKVARVINQVERPLTSAMDHLHATIHLEMEKAFRHPQSLIPENMIVRKDPDLVSTWTRAVETAKVIGDKAMQADLDTIQKAVDDHFNNYMQDVRDVVAYLAQKGESHQVSRQQHDSTGSTPMTKENCGLPTSSTLGSGINRFTSFLEIEEHHAQLFHEMALSSLVSNIFKMDIAMNEGRTVQNLKASCAYLKTVHYQKYSKYCYVMAYDALARMKSDACSKQTKNNGLSCVVVPSIYPGMTMDRKWIRKEKELRQLKI
ncbi:unnamed protein product [Absidia cylindrospora]